eukprot:scaffold118275_cov51-Phaeocystis_antarctica.AAC.2
MHPATLCVHPARRNLVLTERMPTKYVPTKWLPTHLAGSTATQPLHSRRNLVRTELPSHLAGSTASAIALSMEAAAETRAILSE